MTLAVAKRNRKAEYTITLSIDFRRPMTKEDAEDYIGGAIEEYCRGDPAFDGLRWKVEGVK